MSLFKDFGFNIRNTEISAATLKSYFLVYKITKTFS